MSSREEREWIAHELEARSLIPDRSRRAAIHAEAEQVAQRVQRRRRATAQQRVLDLLARRDVPDDDE